MKYHGKHKANPINPYTKPNRKVHFWTCEDCGSIHWSTDKEEPNCSCKTRHEPVPILAMGKCAVKFWKKLMSLIKYYP